MQKITTQLLLELDACDDQVELFQETFGDLAESGVTFTEENIDKVYSANLEFDWIVHNVFPVKLRDEHKKQNGALLSEYEKQNGALWNEYEMQRRSLWDEYEMQRRSLWDEYEMQRKPLWDEYEMQRKPLWDEYNRQKLQLFKQLALGRNSMKMDKTTSDKIKECNMKICNDQDFGSWKVECCKIFKPGLSLNIIEEHVDLDIAVDIVYQLCHAVSLDESVLENLRSKRWFKQQILNY